MSAKKQPTRYQGFTNEIKGFFFLKLEFRSQIGQD